MTSHFNRFLTSPLPFVMLSQKLYKLKFCLLSMPCVVYVVQLLSWNPKQSYLQNMANNFYLCVPMLSPKRWNCDEGLSLPVDQIGNSLPEAFATRLASKRTFSAVNPFVVLFNKIGCICKKVYSRKLFTLINASYYYDSKYYRLLYCDQTTKFPSSNILQSWQRSPCFTIKQSPSEINPGILP